MYRLAVRTKPHEKVITKKYSKNCYHSFNPNVSKHCILFEQ